MNTLPCHSALSRRRFSPLLTRTFPGVAGLLAIVLISGCARFSTIQTDISYDQGQPLRTITTKATGYTFFSGRSTLATWKASQTDKTQGASVGGLALEGGQTNQVSDIAARITEAAIKAAIKP